MSLLIYNVSVMGTGAEYILIRNGMIVELGKGTPPPAGEKINGNGALITPGFCDSHTHLENIAILHDTLDLSGKSRSESLEMVRDICKHRKMVIGRGWDESFWKDGRYLSVDELDNVCSDREVFLIREDGHLAVVNRYVLKKYGFSNKNGILREGDIEKFIKKKQLFSDLDFHYAQNYALSKGVTCVHDFAGNNTLRHYFEMHMKNELKIRIYANFYEESYDKIKKLGLYSGFGDSMLRIGALKLFSDGSIGAGTAATQYKDGTTVVPMLTRKKLRKRTLEANAHGIRVFTHAIGDIAIDEVLAAYRGTSGNRIEHFELMNDEHIQLVGKNSLSMQPNFLKWAKRGGLYEKKLGTERLFKNNQYREILNAGVNVLFGSDCMPLDPLYGIKMAVNSEFPHQRIALNKAFYLYTKGAKYMNKKLGEIKVGAIADLVAIKDERINFTMVNGEIRYNRLLSDTTEKYGTI